VNGLDALVVTKLDVLDRFDEIRVAEAYDVPEGSGGFPAAGRGLDGVTPRWRTFPGWRASTEAARQWSDLPTAAREYLEWIEDAVGVPITSVSVGAKRDAEVRR